MPLNDYEFAYNGLTFGGSLPIGLIEVEGLTDLEARLGDLGIPRGSGDIPGLVTARARSIELHLKASGPKRSEELQDLIEEALVAFAMRQEPLALTWKEPGTYERLVFARPVSSHIPRNPTLTHAFRPFSIRLKASDPRVYSSAQYADSMTVYNPSGGGIDYNKDGNIDYLGDSSAGEIVANNAGNADAFPLIRFYGPASGTMTGATIQNITTGAEADFDFDTGLLAADIYSADMRRIVSVDAGDVPYIRRNEANRYGEWQLPRTPFALAPGDNVLRFEVDGTTTTSYAVASWRDTSL